MYGIVNKALEEMVTHQQGESVWRDITQRAGLTDEVFLSSEAYPDEMTYQLVGAASEVLKRPPTELLEDFGRYWILETGRRGYGGLLESGGHNLREFLLNLPNFHVRIMLIYPKLQPPEFSCVPASDTSICVRYFSSRGGLAPFVLGILDGVGQLFSTATTIRQTHARLDNNDYDEFIVAWEEP